MGRRHGAMLSVALGIALALCAGLPTMGQAQQQGTALSQNTAPPVPRTPILTVDSERMFAESKYGEQIASEFDARAAEINAENRKIEAELSEEERDLTEKRKEMDADAFRALADAFDEKVNRIRKEREEQAHDLGQESDAARHEFVLKAQPVLKQIMDEAGALVIMERRSVLMSRDVIDITDEAVSRIDSTFLTPVAGGEDVDTEAAPVDPAVPDDRERDDASSSETVSGKEVPEDTGGGDNQ